jgi:hypothetical protein
MAVPFEQLVASTYDEVVTERGKKAADQWSDASALNFIESKGGVQRVAGGPTLQMPLDYRQNPAADFLLTDVTPTGTDKTQVLTAASYSWATLVVPANWSIPDEVLNADANQKIDLVAGIVDNVISTHDQAVEAGMFATTGGTDGFNTMVDLFTENGEGTVGTINAAVETWWKNPFKDWAADTGATLIADYTTLWNACQKGSSGKAPNVVVSNSTLHAAFEAALVANQRYVTTSAATGVAGFKALQMKTADFIFSSVITTAQDSAWMWNTNDTKLFVVRGAFRQRRPTMDFVNALMVNMKTFSVLQLATRNRSRGGVLFT